MDTNLLNKTAEELAALLREELSQGMQLKNPLVRPDLPAVDLMTLLTEMTRLKAEIRSQTTTVRETHETMARGLELLEQERVAAQQRVASLESQHQALMEEERSRTIDALIDMADRLEVAIGSASVLAMRRRWLGLRKPDPLARAMMEGLKLTLQQVQQHLGDRGVHRLSVVGSSYDPETMEAVGTVTDSGHKEGVVLEEVTAGYRSSTKMIRTAQVVVNSAAACSDSPGDIGAATQKKTLPPQSRLQ